MDPTANIVFISNMTRNEDGLAGIKGIIELQKAKTLTKIPIMMYIGDIEKAK